MARDPLTGFRLLRIGLNPSRQGALRRLNRRADRCLPPALSRRRSAFSTAIGPVKALDSLGYRQAKAVLAGT